MLRVLAIMFVVAFAAGPAMAQQEDEGFERGLIRSLMGALGLEDGSKPTIDYRERAPLVVPGNRNALPSPQESVAASNPAWPKDPDQERARAQNRNASEGKKSNEGLLSRRELASGGAKGTGRVVEPYVDPKVRDGNYNSGQFNSTFATIGKLVGRSDDQKPIAFTGEPERRSLVEPPPGFRTPSPNAVYGPVGENVGDKTVIEQRKEAGVRR